MVEFVFLSTRMLCLLVESSKGFELQIHAFSHMLFNLECGDFWNSWLLAYLNSHFPPGKVTEVHRKNHKSLLSALSTHTLMGGLVHHTCPIWLILVNVLHHCKVTIFLFLIKGTHGPGLDIYNLCPFNVWARLESADRQHDLQPARPDWLNGRAHTWLLRGLSWPWATHPCSQGRVGMDPAWCNLVNITIYLRAQLFSYTALFPVIAMLCLVCRELFYKNFTLLMLLLLLLIFVI